MSAHKQYLVYQAHRQYVGEVYLSTTHAIVAGPFPDEEEANAEARRRWKRDQRCYVREIGDTTGLSPEPACTCREQAPDPTCFLGPYLSGKASAISGLMGSPGFGCLTAGVQHAIAQQQEAWRRKYLLHLLRRKSTGTL